MSHLSYAWLVECVCAIFYFLEGVVLPEEWSGSLGQSGSFVTLRGFISFANSVRGSLKLGAFPEGSNAPSSGALLEDMVRNY